MNKSSEIWNSEICKWLLLSLFLQHIKMSNPEKLKTEKTELAREIAIENREKIELETERLEKLDIEIENQVYLEVGRDMIREKLDVRKKETEKLKNLENTKKNPEKLDLKKLKELHKLKVERL